MLTLNPIISDAILDTRGPLPTHLGGVGRRPPDRGGGRRRDRASRRRSEVRLQLPRLREVLWQEGGDEARQENHQRVREYSDKDDMMIIVTLIVGIFMLGGIDLRRSLGTWLVRSGSSLKLNQCQYKIDWELGY